MAESTNFVSNINANPLQAQVLEWIIGSGYQSNPNAYVQAIPITYVSSSWAPTLIFYGKSDQIVPVQQSLDLKKKLDQLNVINKLIVYENLGHEFAGMDKNPEFLTELKSWFSLYLK